MPTALVIPVIDRSVRGLCAKPYPGHPKGCPNFRKKDGCPPAAPLFVDTYDLSKKVVAVWNVFDLAAHVDRMRLKHPDWSWAQLTCCLYWQGTARKSLRDAIKLATYELRWDRLGIETCPEAMGVDVTATMRSIGVELEWPPKTTTVQVALLATPKKGD